MEGGRKKEKLVPTLHFSALPFCKNLPELDNPEFILFDYLAS